MASIAAVFLLLCLQLVSATEAEKSKSITFRDGRKFGEGQRTRGGTYDYKSYLSFPEMERHIQMLQKTHPDKVRLEVAGKSVEGRDIHLVIITTNFRRSEDDLTNATNSIVSHGGQEEKEEEQYIPLNFQGRRKNIPSIRPLKPVIFVDGGIHAREWVSPAAALYLLDQLVKTPSLTSALEWWVMPIVNPDGYEYSRSSPSRRFWRKNRAKTRRTSCDGVDLNRNFDVEWSATNHNPCSETYSGPRAFSEPEARAVRDSLLKIKSRIEAYVTLHTYGQLILYPYGYTVRKAPPQLKTLKKMADGMAEAIRKKYGNEYTVGQASVLGAAAGGSDDYALIKIKAPYSYTLELQDKVHSSLNFHSRGFVLSTNKLPQAVDECWLAIQYLGSQIIKKKRLGVRVTVPEVEKKDTEEGEKKLYPVGWRQVLQQVQRIRAEVEADSKIDLTKNCVRRGTIFICPHMVFWNSMFGTFRS